MARARGTAPTLSVICEQLKAAGIVENLQGLQLLVLPRNPLRKDYAHRVDFRVARAGTALCYLSVGRDLSELRARTLAFSRACPDLVCAPRLWRQVEGWDYFATDYFDGERLETALLKGAVTLEQARQFLRQVAGKLDQTLRSSSSAAMERELVRIFTEAVALPVFGDLDRLLLQGMVFPFIRAGALSLVPQNRWSSCDLIAKNILVSPSGGLRLIDYEFAERTHFFCTEGWRWRHFSKLPREMGELSSYLGDMPASHWGEALCLLQHLIMLHRSMPANVAIEESRLSVRRLLQLTAAAHAGFRGESLVGGLVPPPAVPPAPAPGPKIQLFWAGAGDFEEARSMSQPYVAGGDQAYRFDFELAAGPLRLRLDPVDCPGLIEISAIRLRHSPSAATLLSLTDSAHWQELRLNADLLRLPDTPFLALLALGDDPHFTLPEIQLTSPTGVLTLELWMRFTPDLRRLHPMLSPLLLAVPIAELSLTDAATRPLLGQGPDGREITDLPAAGAVTVMAERNERLQAACDEARAQAERLTSELATVQGSLAEAREQGAQAQAAREAAHDQAERLATELTGVHGLLAAAQGREQRLSAELASAQELLAAARDREAALVADMESGRALCAVARESADKLAGELAAQVERNAALAAENQRLVPLETERQAIGEQWTALRAETARLEETLTETRTQAAKLTRDLAEAVAREAGLEADNRRLRQLETALPKAVAEAMQARREQVALAEKLQAAETARDRAAEAEATAVHRAALLAKHAETLEGRLAAAGTRIEMAAAEADSVARAREAAEQTVAELQAKLVRAEEALAAAREQQICEARGARASQDELSAQVAALAAALAAKEAERALLADRCERMKASFSWQVTSPLRLLRRSVVDPLNRPE